MDCKYKKILLSTGYFPPVQYFSKLIKYENIFIEKYENYIKQTYRNRCIILSANGLQTLSIPIKKESGRKTKISDIKIDYTTNWQKNHFRSISSAYFSSPFYEFYIDAFLIFFEKKYKYLFDLNLDIIKALLGELEEYKNIYFTKSYISNPNFDDFRTKIHPKKNFPDLDFVPKKYTQVFSEKFEFQKNLSILDLLFNEGPAGIGFLV